jgi:NAD-dependent protein deacetylase/lipoamidase
MIDIGADDRVFVLTGAGISAESGIPTFRGAGGLWEGHRIEEVASPIAWARDAEMVWKFYSWRRQKALACDPNPAHAALAALEARIGERLYLCTQNVDDLHERAGSKRVVHMHGELFKSRCDRTACATVPFEDRKSYPSRDAIARCSCGGVVRPHIVWFGEVPFFLDEIFHELERATIFVTVGSSGVVEPAASFASAARTGMPARTYHVGPEAPANRELFDELFSGPAGEVLPKLFQTA